MPHLYDHDGEDAVPDLARFADWIDFRPVDWDSVELDDLYRWNQELGKRRWPHPSTRND